jgi:hypothetical protein
MNNARIAFKYVLCDEELIVSTRSRWHRVLVLASLRLQEAHLLVIRGREDFFLLGVSGELPWEDFLLYVGVWADFRDLECHTLVHKFRIQILSLDFLTLVVTARKQFDRVRVRKGCKLPLVFRFPQVALRILNVFVNDSCRQILGHGLLEPSISVLAC